MLATGTGAALTENAWHYIKVVGTSHNSTGAVTVYVDAGFNFVSVESGP